MFQNCSLDCPDLSRPPNVVNLLQKQMDLSGFAILIDFCKMSIIFSDLRRSKEVLFVWVQWNKAFESQPWLKLHFGAAQLPMVMYCPRWPICTSSTWPTCVVCWGRYPGVWDVPERSLRCDRCDMCPGLGTGAWLGLASPLHDPVAFAPAPATLLVLQRCHRSFWRPQMRNMAERWATKQCRKPSCLGGISHWEASSLFSNGCWQCWNKTTCTHQDLNQAAL